MNANRFVRNLLRKYRKTKDSLKRSYGEASGIDVHKLAEADDDSLREKGEYADSILRSVKCKLSSACTIMKMQLLTLVPDKWAINKVRQSIIREMLPCFHSLISTQNLYRDKILHTIPKLTIS